jgi:hypothetical protein
MTTAFGPSEKLAVPAASAPADIEVPMPTASDDPSASISTMPGWWASSPCFTGSLHMTPEEYTNCTLEMSHRSGSASSARSIGLAKTSPTMTRTLAFSRTTRSNSSSARNDGDSRSAMDPPPMSPPKEVSAPVPCMSGHAGQLTAPAPWARMAMRTSSSVPSFGRGFGLPPFSSPNRSSWRHMTPFGMPVVPPV